MSVRAESSEPSVNERIARARAEDLRRKRNAQSKAKTEATVTRQQLLPSASTSSSSRAGLLFLSATDNARREQEEASRIRQLNTQVSGPIPPASWQHDFERLALRRRPDSYSTLHNDEHRAPRELSQDTPLFRSNIAEVLRQFVEPSRVQTVLSLKDLTLCVIADALNQPDESSPSLHDTQRQRSREVLEYLPSHMQERLISLCGRLAQTRYPLSDATALALMDLSKHDTMPKAAEDGDWLDEEDRQQTPCSILDLSCSLLSMHTFRKWISLDSVDMASSLRVLSLAGWRNTAEQSNSDPAYLVNILSRLRNLDMLSFAGSQMGMHNQSATILLRKLGRSLGKLRLLDLSYCEWVSADSIVGVEWFAEKQPTYPALQRLVLHGCAAFQDPKAESVNFDAARPSGNFVASWHARHCRGDIGLAASIRVQAAMNGFDHSSPRRSASVSFSKYVTNVLQPPISSHISMEQNDEKQMPTRSVRCPYSSSKIPTWEWARVQVLDAVRGRIGDSTGFQRQWIDVWF